VNLAFHRRPASPPSLRILYPRSASALTFSFSRRPPRFSLFPLNFKLSTINRFPVTPFPAALTGASQIAENTAPLSPVFAALANRVKHKSFVCRSYKKHPGVGYRLASVFFRFFCLSVANSFRICTSEKRAHNSFRIRTSKTKDLKSFRIRTYGKRWGGCRVVCCLR